MPKSKNIVSENTLVEDKDKYNTSMVDFIEYLDQKLDSNYLSGLSEEEKKFLLLDLQIVVEGIKKIVITIKK